VTWHNNIVINYTRVQVVGPSYNLTLSRPAVTRADAVQEEERRPMWLVFWPTQTMNRTGQSQQTEYRPWNFVTISRYRHGISHNIAIQKFPRFEPYTAGAPPDRGSCSQRQAQLQSTVRSIPTRLWTSSSSNWRCGWCSRWLLIHLWDRQTTSLHWTNHLQQHAKTVSFTGKFSHSKKHTGHPWWRLLLQGASFLQGKVFHQEENHWDTSGGSLSKRNGTTL